MDDGDGAKPVASLALARAHIARIGFLTQDGVLRCFYHGWAFGAEGRCVGAPPIHPNHLPLRPPRAPVHVIPSSHPSHADLADPFSRYAIPYCKCSDRDRIAIVCVQMRARTHNHFISFHLIRDVSSHCRCVDVPTLRDNRRASLNSNCATVYAVLERDGLIWVWRGNPLAADLRKLPRCVPQSNPSTNRTLVLLSR